MLQVSPSQVAQHAARRSFFDRSQMAPQPQAESKIRESPAQVAQREYKESFFEPKTMRPTSLPKVADAFTGNEPSRVQEANVTGGKNKNEAKPTGGGFLIFKDCEGTETGRLGADQGLFMSEDLEIQAGCQGSSSYPV